jgi:hypothetical protein
MSRVAERTPREAFESFARVRALGMLRAAMTPNTELYAFWLAAGCFCFGLMSCSTEARRRLEPQGAPLAASAPTSSASASGAEAAPSAIPSAAIPSAAIPSAAIPSAAIPSAATPSAATPSAGPQLFDAAGVLLPQTDARPSDDSGAFLARMERLAAAIIEDDPARAADVFFPKPAYAVVKAIAKPDADWQARLYRAFERDVHEYHRALGKNPGTFRFAGISVPSARAKFMRPGSEGNRLGYWRVTRSRLELKAQSGEARSFEVTSLISWRGEWYVVHLHGFGS